MASMRSARHRAPGPRIMARHERPPCPSLKDPPWARLRPVGEALYVAATGDGYRRWAKQRGLPRALGHRAGVAALRRTVEGAEALGIERLTVFGFSTENWNRPETEVSEILGLMKAYFASDLGRLERAGVKVRIIGRRENLAPDILAIVEQAEARTAKNDKFHLQVAFNYGGRADIADAARRFAKLVEEGRACATDLDERAFEAQLSTAPAPASTW